VELSSCPGAKGGGLASYGGGPSGGGACSIAAIVGADGPATAAPGVWTAVAAMKSISDRRDTALGGLL